MERKERELEEQLEECKLQKTELFKYFLIGLVLTNSITIILIMELIKK